MCVSEIRVKRIRANQGLGVHKIVASCWDLSKLKTPILFQRYQDMSQI